MQVLIGQRGYRWHEGILGSPKECRRCWDAIRGIKGCWGVRDVLGAGRVAQGALVVS